MLPLLGPFSVCPMEWSVLREEKDYVTVTVDDRTVHDGGDRHLDDRAANSSSLLLIVQWVSVSEEGYCEDTVMNFQFLHWSFKAFMTCLSFLIHLFGVELSIETASASFEIAPCSPFAGHARPVVSRCVIDHLHVLAVHVDCCLKWGRCHPLRSALILRPTIQIIMHRIMENQSVHRERSMEITWWCGIGSDPVNGRHTKLGSSLTATEITFWWLFLE